MVGFQLLLNADQIMKAHHYRSLHRYQLHLHIHDHSQEWKVVNCYDGQDELHVLIVVDSTEIEVEEEGE